MKKAIYSLKAIVLATSLSYAAHGVSLAQPASPPLPESSPTVAKAVTESGIQVIALRTGWVAVKKQHRELTLPRALAVPSIFLGHTWADWMPIFSYVIVHPEKTIVVDTGPSEKVNDPDYYDCDKFNGFFYNRNLKFSAPAGDTLGARLSQNGIDPKSVTAAVVTHFHADHVGGLDLLTNAKVYTGEGNWPNHVGSFTCRLPQGFMPEYPKYEDLPVAGIAQSMAMTTDGKVRLVPLPGHTPGHVGVAVTDGGKTWLIVGDSTFDRAQSERGGVAGVSQNFDQAISTQALLAAEWAKDNLTVLPAHDKSVFDRLK